MTRMVYSVSVLLTVALLAECTLYGETSPDRRGLAFTKHESPAKVVVFSDFVPATLADKSIAKKPAIGETQSVRNGAFIDVEEQEPVTSIEVVSFSGTPACSAGPNNDYQSCSASQGGSSGQGQVCTAQNTLFCSSQPSETHKCSMKDSGDNNAWKCSVVVDSQNQSHEYNCSTLRETRFDCSVLKGSSELCSVDKRYVCSASSNPYVGPGMCSAGDGTSVNCSIVNAPTSPFPTCSTNVGVVCSVQQTDNGAVPAECSIKTNPGVCSAITAPGVAASCSVFDGIGKCSIFNTDSGSCSAYQSGSPDDVSCSARGPKPAGKTLECSVFSNVSGGQSCSTFPGGQFPGFAFCSVFEGGHGGKCSVMQGEGNCSTHGNPHSSC